VLLLIVPVMVKELPLLKAQLPLLLDRLNQTVNAVAGAVRHPGGARRGQHQGLAGQPAGRQHGRTGCRAALSSARIGGSVLLSLFGNAVLVPVVLFYLLIDWPQLVHRGCSELVPPRLRATFSQVPRGDAIRCLGSTCGVSGW
jgi:predicted PurR-regulated permease PerM